MSEYATKANQEAQLAEYKRAHAELDRQEAGDEVSKSARQQRPTLYPDPVANPPPALEDLAVNVPGFSPSTNPRGGCLDTSPRIPTSDRTKSQDKEKNTHGIDSRIYNLSARRCVQLDPKNLPINPAKGASALGNAVLAGVSAAAGGIKMAIATGLSPASVTGVGALPSTALAAWGSWDLVSSKAAWARARQQWKEAQRERWGDARWKNLYGMLPGGTDFDDPNEISGPLEYYRKKGWGKFWSEAGYL